MHKILKSSFIIFLSFLMLSMPVLAIDNSTIITTQEEYYNASSPVGYFEQYPPGTYVQTTNAGYGYGYGYAPFQEQVIQVPPQQNVPNTLATVTPAQAQYAQPVPVAATYNQPMPATRQQIEVPQSYNKKVVTTQVTRDDRDTIDKVLDRSGKAVAIVGIGGLLAAAVTAIFCSIR